MKGYKTLAVNGAVAVLPLLDTLINNGALVQHVLGQYGVAVVSLLGLANVVLRWVTTTPILKSE